MGIWRDRRPAGALPATDHAISVPSEEETIGMIQMNLYDLKGVSKDSIVLTDGATEVTITFDDTPEDMGFINPTKEEHAAFFKHIKCQVGLEAPLQPSHESRTLDIFLDHQVIDYGLLRSVPFPFPIIKFEVIA
jgi:hypothetical protein